MLPISLMYANAQHFLAVVIVVEPIIKPVGAGFGIFEHSAICVIAVFKFSMHFGRVFGVFWPLINNAFGKFRFPEQAERWRGVGFFMGCEDGFVIAGQNAVFGSVGRLSSRVSKVLLLHVVVEP